MITIFGGNGKFANYFIKNVFDNSVKSFTTFDKKQFNELGKIEQFGISSELFISTSDTLLFCTSYSVTKQILNKIYNLITPKHTLIDICSVKSNLYDLNKIKAKNIISIHPLYSPDNKLDKENRHCIICNIRGKLNSNMYTNYFTTKEMSVEEHDKTSAIIQASIHFQNYVTANYLKRKEIAFTTNMYHILTPIIERQLNQNPDMMTEIQVFNPYVKSSINLLKNCFDEFFEIVSEGNYDKVNEYIKNSK